MVWAWLIFMILEPDWYLWFEFSQTDKVSLAHLPHPVIIMIKYTPAEFKNVGRQKEENQNFQEDNADAGMDADADDADNDGADNATMGADDAGERCWLWGSFLLVPVDIYNMHRCKMLICEM